MKTNRRRNADYTSITQLDWARLAAFIDGEGCILLAYNKQKARYYSYIRIVITNTDPRLIRWLATTFGGGVMRGTRKSVKHRQVFKWGVSCRQAEEILLRCRPYFITKGDQADIALAFQETLQGFRRGKPLPEEIVRLREQYHAQLQEARWRQHPIEDLMVPRSTAAH